MISKSKLDDSGFHTPFRFDRNKNGGGILFYVRENVSAKLLSPDFPSGESVFVEMILPKEK